MEEDSSHEFIEFYLNDPKVTSVRERNKARCRISENLDYYKEQMGVLQVKALDSLWCSPVLWDSEGRRFYPMRDGLQSHLSPNHTYNLNLVLL